MIVIVDTREQTPFDFGRFPDVVTRRDTLPTGDYSLAGFESVVACEMKPTAALQSLFAFQIRYGTAFLFCGNRAGAEYACHSLLSKYLYELQRRLSLAIRAGHGFEERKATA